MPRRKRKQDRAMSELTTANWLSEMVASASISDEDIETARKQSYIKDLALYTAVGLIADLVCRCERKIYQDGHQVRNTAWYRWNVEANPNQSADDLLTRWIVDTYYQRQGGLVVSVNGRLYNADGFSIDEKPLEGDIYKNVQIGTEQLLRDFRPDSVYYLRINDKKGRSVANLVDGAFQSYSDLLDAAADSYSQGSGEKYALNLDQMPAGTADENKAYLDAVRSNMSDFIDSRNAVYPLTREQTLTRLSAGSSSSSTGASTYESIRQEVYSIVCEALHLPVSLLEGNTNNTAEAVNQALTFAVGPLCHRISMELTRKTFSQKDILERGSRVELDAAQIRVRDVVEVADKLDKLISSGIMCIDEARVQCGLQPLDEEWSRAHYLTKNYEGIEQIDPHDDDIEIVAEGGDSE